MTHRTVLQLTGMLSTKYGGMERYLLEIARQCNEYGLKTVIQYEREPTSAEYRQDLANAGVKTVVVELQSSPAKASKLIAGLIWRTKPQIIQTHFVPGRLMSSIFMLGRAAGVRRFVSMVHNLGRSPSRLKHRLTYLGFEHVLGVSHAVAECLRDGGIPSSRVATHYMGLIGPPAFSIAERSRLRAELGLPADSIVFAVIAFHAFFKGNDVLLEAFSTVVDAHPSAHLLQLGIDPSTDPLCARFSACRNVHFLGIRDHASAYLNAVDVYVQPSRSAEGLPLSIMEAMAMHRPVVATAVSGNKEAVVHEVTGLIVPPGNASKLAQGMIEMGFKRTEVERTRIGAAGFERFQEMFDGRASVQTLIDRYYLA
jgi:L-malate glycosyltransferase